MAEEDDRQDQFPVSETQSILGSRSDTDILTRRWKEALAKCKRDMDRKDFETVEKYTSLQQMLDDLEQWQKESKAASWANCPDEILPAVRAVDNLSIFFVTMLGSVETAMIWGVLHLALKLSLLHEKRWERMKNMLEQIRCKLALFESCAKCLDQFKDSYEIANALVEVLAGLMKFWVQVVKWYKDNPINKLTTEVLSLFNSKFDKALSSLEGHIKHLHDLAFYGRFKDGHSIYNGSRDPLLSNLLLSDDDVVLPCHILPFPRARDFYGRKTILSEINSQLEYLPGSSQLRSYVIYGLGGVGKTQIALEYAHQSLSKFDAIAWIDGETSASLRASFSKFATELKLTGSKTGTEETHEENFQVVQSWLRKESSQINGRKWCLIFDNCEKFGLLKKYWPSCAGSVLVTARYQQVAKDAKSPGQMVPLFDPVESSEFFRRQLDWTLDSEAEVLATATILEKLGGLALGIHSISALINKRGESPTAIQDFLTLYERHGARIHQKPNEKIDYHLNLAMVWQIAFHNLPKNAKTLLGVISLISPDGIPTELFTPRHSATLKSDLEFCKDDLELDEAFEELNSSGLMSRKNRILSIHRLVQQAYYHQLSPEELQTTFDATCRLVHEAFPKQINGRSMYKESAQCEIYIQHGKFLALRFAELKASGSLLTPSLDFFELLKNCAWYFYENANHQENLIVLGIAFDSYPEDQKDTMLYAHLQNSAALSRYELNELDIARNHINVTHQIREARLDPDDPNTEEQLAGVYNNMGLIESAAGNFETAFKYFERSNEIHNGVDTEQKNHLLHINWGRTFLLNGKIKEGLEQYKLAEDIILEKFDKKALIYAHMQHFWGNFELRRNNYSDAQQYFIRSLELFKEIAPTNVIVAAVHFKLAFLLWKFDEHDESLSHLEEGYKLAESRQPAGRLEIPRNLILQAMVLESKSPDPELRKDADVARLQARRLKRQLLGDIKAGAMGDDDLAAYDALTCGYHRF